MNELYERFDGLTRSINDIHVTIRCGIGNVDFMHFFLKPIIGTFAFAIYQFKLSND